MAYSSNTSSCQRPSRSLVVANNTHLARAAQELEALRCHLTTEPHGTHVVARDIGMHFPPACRAFLLSLAGNSHCADCGAPRPEWASVSYGILLCVQCCGRHRSYGVQTSRVRSIDMDTWNHAQVLAMLEGGNDQLGKFFARHEMHGSSPSNRSADMMCKRYKTKAALFYRTNLQKHVEQVAESGVYEGREAARRSASRSRSPTSTTSSAAHRITPPRTKSEPLRAMAVMAAQQQQQQLNTQRPIQPHEIAAS